jgi:uncharacterized tellurite resistance protein B-like protein
MEASVRIPANWSVNHSAAFLLLCAAGVDGFRRDELGTVVPGLQRLGMSEEAATETAREAFEHYREHTQTDTVEDALVLHTIELKRRMPPSERASTLQLLHEVSQIDREVSEGERLVLTLIEQLWHDDDG